MGLRANGQAAWLKKAAAEADILLDEEDRDEDDKTEQDQVRMVELAFIGAR